jgi:ubiquinone/menaquinone biosynthesis C-methylase UbiE
MSHSATELRDRWDAFAPIFASRVEPTTLQLARTLIEQLRLGDATALLEIGSGAGGCAVAAREVLAQNARHVVTDLSPVMVELARKQLPSDVEVREANAEELPFEDASFDRVLANLNLMLVTDPDRALASAARVLQPGGLAAWSVWGRPEHSPMFAIPPTSAERAGLTLEPPARSNFHLGNRDALREQIIGHGFEHVLAWYQPMIPAHANATDHVDMILSLPGWSLTLQDKPDELRAAVRKEMITDFEQVHARGEPIQLDALVVLARRASD